MTQLSRRGLIQGLAAFAPIALLTPTLPAFARRASLDIAPVRHLAWDLGNPAGDESALLTYYQGPDGLMVVEAKTGIVGRVGEQVAAYQAAMNPTFMPTELGTLHGESLAEWAAWRDRMVFSEYLKDQLWSHAKWEAQRLGLTIDSWSMAKVEEWALTNPGLLHDKALWPTRETVTRALEEEKVRYVEAIIWKPWRDLA